MSKGTEKVAEANAKLIEKGAVLSETKMAVQTWKPVDGGVKITEVICVDPAGALPQMIKDKIAKSNSAGLKKMVHHLQTKKKLPLTN